MKCFTDNVRNDIIALPVDENFNEKISHLDFNNFPVVNVNRFSILYNAEEVQTEDECVLDSEDNNVQATRDHNINDDCNSANFDTNCDKQCDNISVYHDDSHCNVLDDRASIDLEARDTFGQLRKYRNSHMKSLILGYININSLMKCFHEVCEMMSDGLVDVFSIGESKLDEAISDNLVAVPNYKAYRHDVSRIAHGLITYIRSDIAHFRRKDLENSCLNYQCVILEVWIQKQKWFFMSIYKPPSVDETFFVNDLMFICDQMLLESDNIVLNGDLNINMLTAGNRLEEFCNLYGFVNLVKDPTRF